MYRHKTMKYATDKMNEDMHGVGLSTVWTTFSPLICGLNASSPAPQSGLRADIQLPLKCVCKWNLKEPK